KKVNRIPWSEEMRFTIHSKAASTSPKMIIAFPGEADCDLFLCSSALSELRFFKKQPQNAFWGIRVALFKAFPYAFLRKGNCKIRFTESGLPFRQDTMMSFRRKATLIGAFEKCGCLFAETRSFSPKKSNHKS
ncbi:MAG: hypothetical protein VZR30_01955, partial [Acutalibacteraceae bacterium]|nr:hypothetical protein [Acutalibacteraceae bacterium]